VVRGDSNPDAAPDDPGHRRRRKGSPGTRECAQTRGASGPASCSSARTSGPRATSRHRVRAGRRGHRRVGRGEPTHQ
jgi:hypothetical protein